MGRYHLTFWLMATTLVLVVSGCAAGSQSKLPFEDDFSDTRSGWGTTETETFTQGHVEGEYFIEVQSPNWFIWAHPGKLLEDVAVEADLYLAPDSENGYAGVLCRHQDLHNFYYFAISSGGYYAIFRRVDGGELEILSGGGSAIFSEVIRQGERVNHILGVCQGTTLSLYANGELLETVADSAHTLGDVGVGVASGAEGNARFHFDNFRATEP